MPVHRVPAGYRDDTATLMKAHHALSPSRRAESRYMLDLLRILGQVHAGVLHVVHREHLGRPPRDPEHRHDARDVGLGADLLRRILKFVRPEVQRSFDFMADEVDAASLRGTALVGIRPRDVPGLAKLIDAARTKNVALITRASQDFLDQVRETLAEHEGEEHGAIAAALEERVGVSKSRAVLIARDQTLKLNAALNRQRQQAAGITRYRWSTSHDERVRPSHRELDGQVFAYDDPPEPDDEPANPGEPVNCRCIAIPVLAELDVPEGAEEPDEDEPELAAAAE